MFNLMLSFNVLPSAVVGHSSGEIAAAYVRPNGVYHYIFVCSTNSSISFAGGYICRESAWKLAYFRGVCSAELAKCSNANAAGTMISIALSEAKATQMVDIANRNARTFGISIACINSPRNTTVAGEVWLVDQLKADLDNLKIFNRKLRVPVAYHSRQMEMISSKYLNMIGSLCKPTDPRALVPMISSVSGALASPSQLVDPSYWILNMTSPVQFDRAVTVLCQQTGTNMVKKIDGSHKFASIIHHIVEMGPHAALQGPLREIIQATPRGASIGYSSILRRGQSALETALGALGTLHCMGYPIDLAPVNAPLKMSGSMVQPTLLVDLPGYPFDHSQQYWEESRLSRNYRLRNYPPSQLLGVRSNDWNSSDARWRHFIPSGEMHWSEQHMIRGTVLYPGSGMLVMAIEAAKQVTTQTQNIESYTFRDINIEGPIALGTNSGPVEVQTHLSELNSNTMVEKKYKFVIRTWSHDDWILNCCGIVSVNFKDTGNWTRSKTTLQQRRMAAALEYIASQCVRPVDFRYMYSFLRENGYEYGPAFQAAREQHYNHTLKQASAQVDLFHMTEESHVIHPVTLDAIMHLALTAKTLGGSQAIATSIPSRIGCLWLSNDGLSWPNQSSVLACASVKSISRRGFTCTGGVIANSTQGELRLWYDDFELANITSTGVSEPQFLNPKQFLMEIETRPSLDKLSHEAVRALIRHSRPVTQDLTTFHSTVRVLVELTLQRLIASVNPESFAGQGTWKDQYFSWAKHHLANRHYTSSVDVYHDGLAYERLVEDVSNANSMGRVYAVVASNLIPLFKDEANALELLLKSGLLKRFYADWTAYQCAKQAAYYIELLAHQKPGMNILEVGGGTAATTRNLIGALRSGSAASARSLRCHRYDFTDVSAAFLDEAREEFMVYEAQMRFGRLDIEQDLASQGYEEGSYHVVVADNVLHVTPNLGETLRNVRKALRTGGKLIMHEFLKPNGWTAGFIFGVFPGWWFGADDGRTLSPSLAPSEWDTLLKMNGFSGVDIIFRDFEDDVSHQVGWLVTTAVQESSVPARGPELSHHQSIIIIDPSSEVQQGLACELVEHFRDLTGRESSVLDLATAASAQLAAEDALVIFLVDYGPSFLGALNEAQWNNMSTVLQKSHRILWVTAGGGHGASPDHGLLDGLARTLRTENYELHLVTAALDVSGSQPKAPHLKRLALEMLSRTAEQYYEPSYIEIDGILHIQRLVEAADLKAAMDSSLKPYHTSSVPNDGTARFHLSSDLSAGIDVSTFYVLEPGLPAELLSGENVEILVRAASILGPENDTPPSAREDLAYSGYCSGIIIDPGSGSTFKAGDRVLALYSNPLRSHVQANCQLVTKIPGNIAFTDACHVIPPIVTAYHATVEVGKIRPGQSILIQNGSSSFGQAALSILPGRGIAEIWTTISSGEDVDAWARKHHWVPEDRILPDDWFSSQSMLIAGLKRKFDVVLCQANDGVPLLLDYVRSGGRVVTVCSSSPIIGSCRPVSSAPPDVCISTIFAATATPEALTFAISALSPGLLAAAHEANVIPASEVSKAPRTIQRLDDFVPDVVAFDEGQSLDVSAFRYMGTF
jgi:acyl transferase domain-containing protein/NADPH:quinone reductase-like Zn-dependent oxidoreductase